MFTLPYRIAAGVALMLALFGAGYWQGYQHERTVWAADTAKRNAAEAAAIIARTAENAKLTAKQAETSAAITKAKDEELASIRARLADAQRMRKPAFCGGPAATAKAESPTSSDATDPGTGLLPQAVAGDINALILRTEEVAATARACQSFVRDNGME